MLVVRGNRLPRSVHGCPRTRPSRTRTLRLSLWTSSGSRTRGASTDGCALVLPASLVRFSPFCSGSWSLADSKARTVARGGLRRSCARACRVGGSAAARGSPAPAARPVTRRRAALPGLRLSFVTHLRYKGPDRLFPFPHGLLDAASASGGWAMTFEKILDQAIAVGGDLKLHQYRRFENG